MEENGTPKKFNSFLSNPRIQPARKNALKKVDVDNYWLKIFSIVNSYDRNMEPVEALKYLLAEHLNMDELFNKEETVEEYLTTLDARLPEQPEGFRAMLVAYFYYFEYACIDLGPVNFGYTPNLIGVIEETRSYRNHRLIEMFEPSMIYSSVIPHAANKAAIPEGLFKTVCVCLYTSLKDKNWPVREAATKIAATKFIGQLTIPEGQFETVCLWFDTLLKDKDRQVRQAAAEAIFQLTIPESQFKTVCVWLDTWLKNTDGEVRYLTATAIGELTIPEGQFKTVCVWLDTWLKDKDRYVRRAAAKLIGQLTVPEGQFETICVWLDTLLKDNDEYVRQAAAKVIRQLTVPEGQFETVVEMLEFCTKHALIKLPVRINITKSFIASYSTKLLMTLFIHLEKKYHSCDDDQARYSCLEYLLEIQKRLNQHKVAVNIQHAMTSISGPSFINNGYKDLPKKTRWSSTELRINILFHIYGQNLKKISSLTRRLKIFADI